MQTNDGALLFQVRADQSQIQKDVEAIKKQFEQMTQKAVEEGKKQAQVWQNLIKGATAYFTLQGAQSFISQVIAVRSQFQQLEISFGTMLKSKEKANTLMAQMADLAAKTPFGLQEVSEGAKRLLAFQIPAEEVTETLRRMGDVASGLGVPMGQLIHVYGQVKAQGKLMTNDLYQFMNAGIPIIAELSKVVGKSETEIKDMVSAGKIGFPEVQAVIKNMTNEGGLFFNLMAEQSKTLEGQISNLEDNFDQMLNEIGKATEGIASGAISGVAFLVENYQTLGKVIAGLIATYGTYRTAVLMNILLTKGWSVAAKEDAIAKGIQTIATKAQTVATGALNAVMMANPYVLVATAVVGLGAAIWALSDNTTAAEKAQKRFNDILKETSEQSQKEKDDVDKLIATIKDENVERGERIKAFDTLKSKYEEVFGKYKTEEELVQNLNQAYKELNNTLNQRTNEVLQKQLDNVNKRIAINQKAIEQYNKGAYKGLTGLLEISSTKRTLEKDTQLRNKLDNELQYRKVVKYEAEYKGMSLEDRKKHIRSILFEMEQRKVGAQGLSLYDGLSDKNVWRLHQTLKDSIASEEKVNTALIKRSEIQKQIAEKQKEIRKLNNLYKADKLDKAGEERLNTLKKELELLQKQDSTNSGEDKKRGTTKTAKSELPTFDYDKAQRDRARQLQDELFAQEEARIKIMEDGTEKRLALIQLEYDKQEEIIRRNSEDQLNAFIELEKQKAESAGTWKKGQAFNTDTPAINAEKARLAENEKALLNSNAEYQRIQQEQLYKDLLEKYQTYTDQRKAIEEKYNADIEALQAKLGADAPQVKKAQDEKARELKKLDILYKKEGTAIAKLFDNLRKKTVKEIRQTIAEAEKEIDALASNLDMGDKDNVEYIQNLRQQLEQTRDTADRSDTVFGKLGANIKKMFNAKPNTAEWQEGFNGLLSSAQSITSEFGQLGAEIENIGKGIGNKSLEKLGETIQNVSNIINKTMSFAQIGGSVGSGWGAAIGAVVGIFASGFEKQAKARAQQEKELAELMHQRLNIQLEYNRALYEEQMLMKKNTSVFGTKEIANAVEYMKIFNQQKDFYQSKMATRKLTNEEIAERKRVLNYLYSTDKKLQNGDNPDAFSRYQNKKFREYYYELKSGYKKMESLAGIEIQTGSRTTGILWWKKTKEVWNNLTDVYKDIIKADGDLNLQMAESLLKNATFNNDGKEKLQEIVDAYKQALEAEKKYDEFLQGIFGQLGNSFIDNVLKSLKTGEDAFAGFAKSVGSMIESLGKKMAYEIFLADYLKSFQDRVKKKSREIANSGLSESEMSKKTSEMMKTEIATISQEMKGKIGVMQNFFREFMGALPKEMNTLNEQRQAVEKGFARMSQDSADELNGQFRLLTQIGAETKNAMLQTANSIKEMHQSMQAQSAQQLKHLAGIEANTYKLNKMETDLAGVKAGINELTTKGIKIRT